MSDLVRIKKRLDMMRERARGRDKRQKDVLSIRAGDYEAVAPGMIPEGFPRALVSNLIDTCARDIAEVMAPLPKVDCASSSQTSEKARRFAQQRSLIANSYIQTSRLADQMYSGADKYGSFGYMIYKVEPDFKNKRPVIEVSESLATYWVQDHRHNVREIAEVFRYKFDELCEIYPEHAGQLASMRDTREDDVDVVHWQDSKTQMIFVPEYNLVLDELPQPLGRPLARIVERPRLDAEVRGQFDDVIWVQVARAMMASYTMLAVEKSVNAPLVVPNDVTQIDYGSYATLQTDNPGGVAQLPLPLPNGLIPEQNILAQEQRVGSRYPEGRTGSMNASIITGAGVEALAGTFDTQVMTFQRLNESALEDVLSMCFELDEKLWPGREKSVRVKDDGSPVSITYTPHKDIAGDYSADVTYGAIAGLDPNRAAVFILQAIGGGLMSKKTGRQYLPVDFDREADERQQNLEMIRESITASVAMLAQAIPGMAAQGQDPRQVVEQIAELAKRIEKGDTPESAVSKVFAPKQKPAEQQAAAVDPMQELMAAAAGGGAGAPPEMGGGGAPSPGQELLGMAGLTASGDANLQATMMGPL